MTIRNDVQDELADGFEPSPLPPVAPDGSLELPPLREPPRYPPRLCEQGPCRHYHTFKIQLDAQKPLAVKGEDGQMEVPEAPNHEEQHHYCYPDVGIESKLGSLPVISCSRWAPMMPHELAISDARIHGFLQSDAGKKFEAELVAYHAEQDRIQADAVAAATTAADDLANMPAATVRLKFEIRDERGVFQPPGGEFLWGATFREVRECIMGGFALTQPKGNVVNPFDDYEVLHWTPTSQRRLELDQTIAQAGLSAGDVVMFNRQPRKES